MSDVSFFYPSPRPPLYDLVRKFSDWRRRKHMCASITKVAFASAALTLFAGSAGAQTVHVEDIRVQLFYENSGVLSEALTKIKDLTLWNTIIGEGSAKGPATSFLISVVLRGKPASFVKAERVVVTVFDESKKAKIVQRRFDSFSFDDEGRVIKPVFVEDNTCTPIRITARSKGDTKTITMPFKCGE
jgi:hypothetical protein